MDSRSDSVTRQIAGRGDLAVPEPADLAHEKHVAIEIRELCECLVDDGRGVLRGGPRLRHGGRRRALPPPMMIECEIAGDAEEPGAQVAVRSGRDRGSGDAQEDVLRQVTRRVSVPDGPAQVAKQPPLVFDKEPLGAGH